MEAVLGKGELVIIDRSGDTKIIWDSNNTDEVEAARKTFTDLRAKGYLAYKTDKKGEKAEQIHTFDPKAERIILSPAMQGG